jgi:hypothetical protein
MPHDDQEVQDRIRRMYEAADELQWPLQPDEVRAMKHPASFGLPDTKLIVAVAAVVVLVVSGFLFAVQPKSHNSTTATPPSTAASTTTVPTPGGNVTVPVGLTRTSVANAQAILAAAGLTSTVTYAANSAPAGTVLAADPPESSVVQKGSAVKLTVSTGPTTVTVPAIVGLSQAQAAAELSTAGLNVGSVTTVDSTTFQPGYVISASPVPGSKVAPGGTVDISVSSGPPQG